MKKITRLLSILTTCLLLTANAEVTLSLGWTIQLQTDWDNASVRTLSDGKICVTGDRSGVNVIPRYHYVGGELVDITYDNYPYNNGGVEIYDQNGVFVDDLLFPDYEGELTYIATLSADSFLVHYGSVWLCSISNSTIVSSEFSVQNLPVTLPGNISAENSDSGIYYYLDNQDLHQILIADSDSTETPISGCLYSGFQGLNYVISWQSDVGDSYQIQSSTSLTNWLDIGTPLIGTGAPLSWANAMTNSESFYRVIKK